ncbi:hypothetical protein ACTU44_10935 [Thalassospira sp. SM2505]|uniref:hypothetical protein n=1 Tax=Thalassospira sp. CH_XMU1448-2 TaxID=3107773 RepID=UPI003008B4A2
MTAKIATYLGMSALHAVRFLPSVIIFAHYAWGLAGADVPTGVMLAISYVSIALVVISVLDFWLFAISTVLFIAADLALMFGLSLVVTKTLMSTSFSMYYFNVIGYWVLLYISGLGAMFVMRRFLRLSKAI